MGSLDLSKIVKNNDNAENVTNELIPNKHNSVEVLPRENNNITSSFPDFTPVTRVDNSTNIKASLPLSATQAIITGIVDSFTALVSAYKEIQISHDQVRIMEIKKDAYIKGKKEETKQIKKKAEYEFKTYLVQCQHELEQKKIEFEQFKLELEEKINKRHDDYKLTEKQLDTCIKAIESLLEGSKTLWSALKENGLNDSNILSNVHIQDEKIHQLLEVLLKVKVN